MTKLLPGLLTGILYLAISGPIMTDQAYPQKTYTCMDCHEDLMQQQFRHAVVDQKGCNLCHKPTWEDHSGKKKSFEFREKMLQLCVNCHEGVLDHNQGHSPVTAGNCTACHSPHSSSFAKLLITEKKDICMNCHNKSLSKDNKPVINMLQLVKTKKYLHKVLETGGCTPCHLPHGSDYPKLLVAAFPGGNYLPAVRDSFDLCFQCHDSDLLEKELTTDATNFRNGDKNLHFKHMHDTKARNCINCHDVHGADNPHLIADKVLFGKWDLPIVFSASESGGSCRTGCHGTKSYTR